MQDSGSRWWGSVGKFELLASIGSMAVSAAATVWAATRDWAPKDMTSVGWLMVFVGMMLSAILALGLAGWARSMWVRSSVTSEQTDTGKPAQPAETSEPPVIVFFMRKHDGPRQDDVFDGHVRLCVGAVLVADDKLTFHGVRARVQVSDPQGWRFVDKVFFEGDLHPGEIVEDYPVEIHLEKAARTLKYKTGPKEDWRYLLNGDRLEYSILVSAVNMPIQTYTATVRSIETDVDYLVLEPQTG